MTAKLNDIDPLTWLADVLARIADMPQSRLPELLPWEWKMSNPLAKVRPLLRSWRILTQKALASWMQPKRCGNCGWYFMVLK